MIEWILNHISTRGWKTEREEKYFRFPMYYALIVYWQWLISFSFAFLATCPTHTHTHTRAHILGLWNHFAKCIQDKRDLNMLVYQSNCNRIARASHKFLYFSVRFSAVLCYTLDFWLNYILCIRTLIDWLINRLYMGVNTRTYILFNVQNAQN